MRAARSEVPKTRRSARSTMFSHAIPGNDKTAWGIRFRRGVKHRRSQRALETIILGLSDDYKSNKSPHRRRLSINSEHNDDIFGYKTFCFRRSCSIALTTTGPIMFCRAPPKQLPGRFRYSPTAYVVVAVSHVMSNNKIQTQ